MQTITGVLGGLGLFLLGMVLMTDALRALAGEAIRSSLVRFTRNPLSGVVTGTVSTAILQSSSATTVAAIGFVSAGLLTFSESLGIVLGANIGTTFTGWLVALLGFKLKLSSVMLPVIFAGVLLRLMFSGRLASFGMVLAGFGLVFVGIGILQTSMESMRELVSPEAFDTSSIGGYLKLFGLGVLIAVVTQSSSAGVATALAAVYTQTINFEQAAIMVIGMNVGTTLSAVLAGIGASVNARRTALSHVLYNIFAAAIGMLMLQPFIQLSEWLVAGAQQDHAEILLVSFHSSFNILSVICLLPFIQLFARLIKKLIANIEDAYTESLDDRLLDRPDLALTAATASIQSETRAMISHLLCMLGSRHTARGGVDLNNLGSAMSETHAYVEKIHIRNDDQPSWNILLSIIHSLDHMQRLLARCEERLNKSAAAMQTPEFYHYIDITRQSLSKLQQAIELNDWQLAHQEAESLAAAISEESKNIRQTIVDSIAAGKLNILRGTDGLKATRWLRRVSAHLLRITHYQAQIHELLKTRKLPD